MTQTVQNPSKPDSIDVPNRATPSVFARLLGRPELGAIAAAVVIYIFFYAVSSSFRSINALSLVLSQSAIVGIVAVAVGLLMVGGEFDLSAGVGAFAAGLAADMLAYQYNFNMIVASLLSLVLMLAIGFLNGYLVVKTGIPSFLVTLGTFFVLQGVNLGVTKVVTGSVSTQDTSDIAGYSTMHDIFASNITIGGTSFSILILWWAVFTAVGGWILTRTRLGNWILAIGGNAASARAVGVPVNKVKIGLFMGVGLMAWFYGQNVLYSSNGVIQAGSGVGNEFIYIIAAVVGGTLLTGGYGSAVGVAIGAFIFGMTNQGIVFAGWDPNWFKAFLGVMLLLAVMVNLYVRKLATTRRS
jgi:simple sugar transport system permease protein